MKNQKFKDISGLIFDYGGTLDTNGRHWAYVLWDGYRHAGVPISEEQFREAYVFGERALAKHPLILPEDNFQVLLVKKVYQEFEYLKRASSLDFSDAECERVEKEIADFCYTEVKRVLIISREVLEILSRRFPLVLVTNFYGNIQAVLRDFNLDKYFLQIIESAVVGVRKPNPEIFKLGVEALRLQPAEVCVIGDSYEKDIVPAVSLGCHTVWFKGEEWKAENHDERITDSIITEILQLPAVFDL